MVLLGCAVPDILFREAGEGAHGELRGHTTVLSCIFPVNQSSDVFQSFQIISPQIASLPTPYQMVENLGFNPAIVSNILFTSLTASLIMTAFWTYSSGIRSNLEYKPKDK